MKYFRGYAASSFIDKWHPGVKSSAMYETAKASGRQHKTSWRNYKNTVYMTENRQKPAAQLSSWYYRSVKRNQVENGSGSILSAQP